MRQELGIEIEGRVTSGKGDASTWLSRFNEAYRRKTGLDVYPGSLNLRLDHEFSLREAQFSEALVFFGRTEYGGDRDILMLPCRLPDLDNLSAFIWRTTNSEASAADRTTIELLAEVHLRDTFGLCDDDLVRVSII